MNIRWYELNSRWTWYHVHPTSSSYHSILYPSELSWVHIMFIPVHSSSSELSWVHIILSWVNISQQLEWTWDEHDTTWTQMKSTQMNIVWYELNSRWTWFGMIWRWSGMNIISCSSELSWFELSSYYLHLS